MRRDICDQCDTDDVPPVGVVDGNPRLITYRYKCPKCGYEWEETWMSGMANE